jgi:GTPase involved in cell partitioning and DNA repair
VVIKDFGPCFISSLLVTSKLDGDGSGDRSTGADGDDKFIEVPLGTVVRDADIV